MTLPKKENWANNDPTLCFLDQLATHTQLSPLHEVLDKLVVFATSLVESDSCFVYVREGDDLVLRASKNPHQEILDRLKLKVGEGITGWVAEHRQTVALGLNAWKDPRFKVFSDLPEDRFESFLSVPILTRGRAVGVINLQNLKPHEYTAHEITSISTIGAFVGAEIEMARLEVENEQDVAERKRAEDRFYKAFNANPEPIAFATIPDERYIAMYRAKAQGKARCEVFDQATRDQAVGRLKLETDLRRALEREEFRVYYQPIVSLATRNIAGFEALVRWDRPGVGIVAPAEFIAVAEEMGLIVFIGNWVLRKACEQAHCWHRENPEERLLTMSVNVSGHQFKKPDFVEQVEKILRETQVDSTTIKLEITESVTMDDAERTIRVVTGLKKLGVRLSIDDFGTGYSSLGYLSRFPMDTLKIDRSFVQNLPTNPENLEIVRTILGLARNVGMDVVAEGPETADEIECLKALECDFGQGYFFSKPVDSEQAGNLLRKTTSIENI